MGDHPYGQHPVESVEGPDCVECGHFADWHHLGSDGRYGCIGCGCSNYVGELHVDCSTALDVVLWGYGTRGPASRKGL